jgi:serine protease
LGLDRLDQTTAITNNQYTYQHTGATKSIWILDTGLTLSNSAVASEFEGRALMVYDFNSVNGVIPDGTEYGRDCLEPIGHGTAVASVAAGKTYGVAKGAMLKIVKISNGCTFNTQADNYVAALNYIAIYAQLGTIVNVSNYLHDSTCNTPNIIPQIEDAIIGAYNRGIIFVTSAGNDGCDTANYTPSRIPEAFVVGATSNVKFFEGKDALFYQSAPLYSSRIGWNISAFAPGQNVPALTKNGTPADISGTSMASPYIAGTFALYCEQFGNCSTRTIASIYAGFRNTGTIGTVTKADGSPLLGATSRFITQRW